MDSHRKYLATVAFCLCSAFALMLPPAATGQTLATTPDSGARIRIWRERARSWQEGTFLRLAGDTLIVQPVRCCGVDTVPLGAVRELMVGRGRERQVSRIAAGAFVGAVVGAGGGVLYTNLECKRSGNELCGIGALFWVPGFAGAGAILGGLLGSRKVERWERIYRSDGAALIVTPTGSGLVAVGVALPLPRRRSPQFSPMSPALSRRLTLQAFEPERTVTP